MKELKKFKKKDLIKLLDKCSGDAAKFYGKLEKISSKSTPQMWVAIDECDNILDYNEGDFNMIVRHPKWEASILFINGELDIIEFRK